MKKERDAVWHPFLFYNRSETVGTRCVASLRFIIPKLLSDGPIPNNVILR